MNTKEENELTKTNIYRFKLEPNIIELVNSFAKMHQYDNRQDYKEAWDVWYEEQEEFKREELRLLELGYNKNVKHKIYKSGRYYFRNKSNMETSPKKRCTYITLNQDLLENMDNHIKENINGSEYTPAKGYEKFCEGNKIILLEEIKRLLNIDKLNGDEIQKKIKKTYKNRYYLISRNVK